MTYATRNDRYTGVRTYPTVDAAAINVPQMLLRRRAQQAIAARRAEYVWLKAHCELYRHYYTNI